MIARRSDLDDPGTGPPGGPAPVGPVATWVIRRRWGSSVFGIVAPGHTRRRPSDVVRVVVAATVIALTAVGATDVTRIEHAAFEVFDSLPGGLERVEGIRIDRRAHQRPPARVW